MTWEKSAGSCGRETNETFSSYLLEPVVSVCVAKREVMKWQNAEQRVKECSAAEASAGRHPYEKIRMEPLRDLKRDIVRIRGLESEIELHRHRHLELKLKIVRPQPLRLLRAIEDKGELRYVLGIFTARHTPEAAARETVPVRSLGPIRPEPRPADRNAAMIRPVGAELDRPGREKHGEIARRPV